MMGEFDKGAYAQLLSGDFSKITKVLLAIEQGEYDQRKLLVQLAQAIGYLSWERKEFHSMVAGQVEKLLGTFVKANADLERITKFMEEFERASRK